MAPKGRIYLVVLLLVALAAAVGAYWRYQVAARKAAAECDTPAPPPKPATPPPKLPDFTLDAGCAPGTDPAKASPSSPKK